MLIQITITIPPTGSAGPFDLFSDANAYSSPFQTQVLLVRVKTVLTYQLIVQLQLQHLLVQRLQLQVQVVQLQQLPLHLRRMNLTLSYIHKLQVI